MYHIYIKLIIKLQKLGLFRVTKLMAKKVKY